MPVGHVSRAFPERTLEGGLVGGVDVGVADGHFSCRRDAAATGFAA